MDSPDPGCIGWLFPSARFVIGLSSPGNQVGLYVVFGSELNMSAAGSSMCRQVCTTSTILRGFMHIQ